MCREEEEEKDEEKQGRSWKCQWARSQLLSTFDRLFWSVLYAYSGQYLSAVYIQRSFELIMVEQV